uniref:restriction endonuclease subunit S n=1 Tax=Lacticaseibacillus paracasei TaxID=1597 RepID=UPI00403F6962
MSKDAKNVPALRFKGYSDAWEKRKLGELAEFINGRAYKQDELLTSGKYPVLRVGNFYTNDKWYYSDLELPEKYYAEKGDLLYTWSATFGPHIWIGPKVIYHYHIWKVALKNLFEKDFALQFFEADRVRLLNSTNGSTMIHVTKKDMESKGILLPDVYEQRTIGELLKRVDDLIAATQHRIDTLEHVKKALLQHVLDQSWRFKGFTDHWKRHKISDIFRVTRGKVLPTSSVANQKSLATPFPVYSSQTKHDGLLGYYHDYLYADAITWTTDGANAGMVKYRPQKFYSTNVNGVLISTQGYANTAVASILNTIAWKYVSHVGNPKLMGKVMADISLELPSIPEQKALSSLLENLNNTIRTTNVKLSKIQLLKSSLLQQLFI